MAMRPLLAILMLLLPGSRAQLKVKTLCRESQMETVILPPTKLAVSEISPVRAGGPPPQVVNYNCSSALNTGTQTATETAQSTA